MSELPETSWKNIGGHAVEVSFTVAEREALRVAYNAAKRDNQAGFNHGGNAYLTAYAGYLIQFLDGQLPPCPVHDNPPMLQEVLDWIDFQVNKKQDFPADHPLTLVESWNEQVGVEFPLNLDQLRELIQAHLNNEPGGL